jgi:hypothetical protein
VLAGRATALSELQNEAVTAMKSLHAELNPSVAAKDADELAHFKAQFRDDIKGTMFLLGLDSEARQADTPIGMYNLGATYASRNDLPWPDATRLRGPVEDAVNADDARAVVLLTHACKDPRNKAWLADDPQLERFRQRAAYRNAFLAKPRDDFFELDPVRPIADRLRASGYGTAWRLASESAQQLELRTYVSAATRAQVIALARLRISLGAYSPSTTPAEEKPLDEWAVEVLDELLGHGLASEDALAALTDAERVSTMTRVAKAVLGRCRLGEGRDPGAYAGSLSGWLTAWSSQP